jgi:cysteinyl-tRNA synthetase
MCAAMKLIAGIQPSPASSFDVTQWRNGCYDAMNDDFNTPIVISQLFEGVRVINSTKEGSITLTAADIELLKSTFEDFFYRVMGLQDEEGKENSQLTDSLMQMILNMRAEAKANKDWPTSDKLRDALAAINIQIKDSKEGTSWTYEG